MCEIRAITKAPLIQFGPRNKGLDLMGFGEPHSWSFIYLGVRLLPYDMVSIQLKSSRVGLLPNSSHILMSLQNINDHDFIDAFHTIFDSNTNTFYIFRVYHT
ncbi:hypothetical protein HanRHA438_Chr15g0729561 [Helianthus annuus]|nr:hypothetical protein HanIR_Chr15g0780551 [Helianthus annuus]KAJ0846850.1 hypothetical protein HanRHA438_Chr15g0729561 [Helianthus annuus]